MSGNGSNVKITTPINATMYFYGTHSGGAQTVTLTANTTWTSGQTGWYSIGIVVPR